MEKKNINKNMQILVELRKNARAQLTKISKSTNIPISTIFDRIKTNSDGIISRHVSLINFEKLGFNARATICVKCPKKTKEGFYSMAAHHQNINALYKINNGFDYMAEVIFRNVKELEEFIEEIEDKFLIRSKQVFYMIDEIVKEKFMSEDLYLDLINQGEYRKVYI
ncbi:Lrp/AsnC ligand binding domain-containing protein [Candidatus Woesearchaeota archaeon]|nr:Lrp/AsnC ligand binding domain-containing protein [Candidatus Woesearchaeota archaeon]